MGQGAAAVGSGSELRIPSGRSYLERERGGARLALVDRVLWKRARVVRKRRRRSDALQPLALELAFRGCEARCDLVGTHARDVRAKSVPQPPAPRFKIAL